MARAPGPPKARSGLDFLLGEHGSSARLPRRRQAGQGSERLQRLARAGTAAGNSGEARDGPKWIEALDDIMAVTGGDLPPKLNGDERSTWEAFPVKAGDRLTFGYLRSGARAYIAVSGGIDVPVKLGSRSTYTLGALGGHEGRALKAGDSLPVESGAGAMGAVPAALRRGPGNPAELRMLPGLYWHRITAAAGKQFFADTWKVAPEADRIGYRFKGGKALDFVPREQPFGAGSNPSNIVDACYPYGSIQVPGGTEPIVLHRDAVSGGGYMMLGCVISADMDLIGQLQPHSPARFVEVSMDQALAARADRKAALARLRAHLGR